MAQQQTATSTSIDPARVAEAFVDLALSGRTTQPDHLPGLVRRTASRLGARDVVMFLVDLAQRELQPLRGRDQGGLEALAVDGTSAGRAYRSEAVVAEPAADGAGTRLWVPIHDSAERVGVLGMTFDGAVGDELERAAVALASGIGEHVMAKSAYGDAIERTKRTTPLSLPAEMRWAVLPPLTYRAPELTISGLVEPPHEVAGDAFDYAVTDGAAHLLVVDAMGHGLRASCMTDLVVAAYRNSRRRGATLEEVRAAMDSALAGEFGEGAFATAVLATLDLRTGQLRWIPCGHPPPLLLRAGMPAEELAAVPTLPIALGGGVAEVGERVLQPGDSLILYTDGVVEARSAAGAHFGLERLTQHISDAAYAGEHHPETLRTLMHGVVDHHAGRLQDDATLLLVTWHGPGDGSDTELPG